MVNFCALCGCCTRTDIVREHLEDTLRICDVSVMGLYEMGFEAKWWTVPAEKFVLVGMCKKSPFTGVEEA
jgi:hypothetical protein